MVDIANKWVRHLRTQDHRDKSDSQSFTCDICGSVIRGIEAWREHVEGDPDHRDRWTATQEVQKRDVKLSNRSNGQDSNDNSTREMDTNAIYTGGQVIPGAVSHRAKRLSPPPTAPLASRSRTRNDVRSEFERRPHKNTSGRQLWAEDNAQPKSRSQWQGPPVKGNRPSQPPKSNDDTPPRMMRQPETRPISQGRLVTEVKIIQFGLLSVGWVQTKWIEVDNSQSSDTDACLNNEQWRALIAFDERLRHEHITCFSTDLLLPGNPIMRKLVSKYTRLAGTPGHDIKAFSGLKDYRVEARIGEHRVDALADTGAQSNFISAQFADKVGLVPRNRIPRSIQLPGGKQVSSLGTVKVPFSFLGELEEHTLDCSIIPGCTSDLILSGPFLRATKTLTTFKNRIKRSIRQIPRKRLRINLIGNERQRIWGSLNGRPALALPDTGSDVMLLSAEWARENKLKIDHDPENRLELELTDGSTVCTTGIVRDAMWTFGDSEQDISCDFYVLDNLLVDAVFSNDFIFELDVYSDFNHYMVDLDSMLDLSELYNVKLISKYSPELARLEEESFNDISSTHARKHERVRRGRVRDAINALDLAKQNEAWEEERRRQLIWNRHHEQHERKAELSNAISSNQTVPQANRQYSPWWKRVLRIG